MLRSVAFCALFAFASILAAQEVTGSITGTVSDSSGAPVAGAAVALLSEQTGARRTQESNPDGSFVFTAVTPGKYTVTAEHHGFKRFQKENIELAPGDNLAVGSLPLEIGTVSESVTVQAEGAMVQTASGERASVITSQEINNLTVMNRDFTTFAELQPGVVINVGAEVQTFSGNNTFNVLGGRTTGNNILIDGIPSTNSNQGNMNTTLSLDATQSVEVKVANFDAKFGRNQGVTIMAVSKGGTQEFHGAAYYYDRNEAFNANNFFNNRSGLPQQEYRISTFGGTFGGPLHIPRVAATKGKLFFFVASEEIREKRPEAEQTLTVPTALERQGNFSQSLINNKAVTIKDPLTGKTFSGNIIPANRILPSTQAYLNLLPLPNFSNTAISNGQYNYIFEESLNVPKRIETGRLDYNFSSNTTMYARFNYWYEDQQGNAVSAGNTKWGWMPQHYTAVTPSGVIAFNHIFNPTTVLQASIGYERFNESGPPLKTSEYTALSRTTTGVNIPQFNPSINPYNLVPSATFGGVSGTSADIANPSYASRFPLYGAENTFNWNGTINKVLGDHTMKAGIYAERWRAMKGLNASNFAGNMNFTSDSNNPQDTGDAYSNALLGIMDSYTESTSRPPQYEFTGSIEWFAQDNWKVTRNLTLDFGVRFGWAVPWHSNHLQEAGFVPSLWNPANAVSLIRPVLVAGKRMGQDPITGAILPAVDIGAIAPEAGNPINGIVYRLTDPSFPEGLHTGTGIKTAPRLSFAWDPFGTGKTVIRGGGGIFYEMHDIDNYGYGIEYTPPIQYNPVINYPTFQTFINQAGYISPSTISGFDPVYHTPVTYNFSLGVQRDIGFGTVLDVAYVGALARHLTLSENLNAAPLGTDWRPQNLDTTTGKPLASQFTRPYIGYGD
ncbi:MAG: carboxypeptidase regulatory-like domain-containing protein, partial [Acidobacteriia bacterium]|nr:carboxypeptidase regulatory-like domain-containing protein [Terriglobia bacterium]